MVKQQLWQLRIDSTVRNWGGDVQKVGYFTVLNSVYDLGLDPYQLSVYVYLIRLNNNGGTAFPSINNIAEKCNMSVRKVGYVIKELEEKKLIEIEYRKEEKMNRSNVYRITSNTAQHAGGTAQYAEGYAQHAGDIPHSMQEGYAQHADYKELSINNKDYKELDKNSSPSSSSIVKKIINYLNEKTGKRFSHKSEANSKLINARLREGRTLDDFKHVIDVKAEEWINDEKMSEYLRPATLFSGKNFESYVNQKSKRQHQSKQWDQRDIDSALSKWVTAGYDPEDFRWNREEGRPYTIAEIEAEQREFEKQKREFDQMLENKPMTSNLSH